MNAVRRLTKAQFRDLEDQLRSERARLERSIASRTGADDAAATTGGILLRGTRAEGGLAVALETRIVDRHAMLDAALGRLEAGTYGVCLGCDKPIPFGRLLVMPEATYCVACGGGA